MVDAYASQTQFHRHLAPIWAALPLERRGRLWKPYRRASWPGEVMIERSAVASPVLVAAAGDAQRFRSRPLIYAEHGAGQSYLPNHRGLSPSYSGGPGYESAVLFLCPNERVAGRWRAIYPTIPAVVVGCPALDQWSIDHEPCPFETVVVTWHWDCTLVPETRTALPHYAAGLRRLKAVVEGHGRRLIGHAHPKARGMEDLYRRVGIEWVPALEDVYARAGMMLVDNSSVGYEFAALGRPTIWMNAPWYRRDVAHGLRFWDQVPGPQVNSLDELLAAVEARLVGDDAAWWETERQRGIAVGREVFGPLDGQAAMRAAVAIATYADSYV